MKNFAMAVATFALVSNVAMAAGKKGEWHCQDATGKAVEGIKTEKECKAPNKVVKGAAAATKAHSTETPKAETTPAQ